MNRRPGMGLNDVELNDPESVGRRKEVQLPLSAPRFAAKAEAAAFQGPGQSLAWGEARVVGPPSLQSPGLHLRPGPNPQYLRDLSFLVCQMSQESTLEGSCEAWQ